MNDNNLPVLHSWYAVLEKHEHRRRLMQTAKTQVQFERQCDLAVITVHMYVGY